MLSAVSASPRCACVIQTTYEPLSNVCPPYVAPCFSSSTWIPFSSSQSTSRFASGSLRCPVPSGITYPFGYSRIQM